MFITEKKFITEKLSKYTSQNIQIEHMNNGGFIMFPVNILPKFKMFYIFFVTPQISGIYSLNF